MPRIDLAIDVRDDKVRVSQPEKGNLFEIPNVIAYEKVNGKVRAVGTTPKELLSNAPSNALNEEISFEKFLDETNIHSHRALACFYYLLAKSQTAVYPNLSKILLPDQFSLNVTFLIEDYHDLSKATQQRLEFEMASLQSISSLKINGKDFHPLIHRTRKLRWIRRAVKVVSHIPFIISIFALIYLVSLMYGMFSQIISAIVFMTLFIIGVPLLGTFFVTLREIIWFKLIKKTVPRDFILEEINQSRYLPNWLKERIVRSVE